MSFTESNTVEQMILDAVGRRTKPALINGCTLDNRCTRNMPIAIIGTKASFEPYRAEI